MDGGGLGRLGFKPLKGGLLSILGLFLSIFCTTGGGFAAQRVGPEPGTQTVARPSANAQTQSAQTQSGRSASAAQTAAAQQPAPSSTVPFKPESSATSAQDEAPLFRSDVRLVRMLATVREGSGQLAGNLMRNDFMITDNGVAQDVAVFEATTEKPLSVAL